ncbi:3-hydroxybutyryl-CoA dehydrogenase [Siminovitchia fordii]|uniref:L-gulonate 3-dehydrogenase n=1 Tax=Siminovitchia fordii TaxID=254759 RepID=A0ABQ4K428_9BACI|nr:3-hydroxybutyryl-CoA dehydrogenase [Siminovitchia fordii]GIN20499.1 3-hydroxybutyryl-CoA dehydrogenase [Siminovitchia fordii]
MKSIRGCILIAGAGRMGRGIALTFAYQGYEVNLVDFKQRTHGEFAQYVIDAKQEIKGQLSILSRSGVLSEESVELVLDRIHIRPKDEKCGWERADIVFEALPEIADAKREAFEFICLKVPQEVPIASTSSAYSANELAEMVTQKERFLNTHWLNPAYLIPLVEVSPGTETSGEVLGEVFQLLERIGKVPVKCAPSPGYIVPRVQALAMNEAARLVEDGVASPEDIDKAVRVGFGLRFAVLGLLEFIDWGGADTLYHASNHLQLSLGTDRFTPPQIIQEKIEQGDIGLKTGRGFYSFDEKRMDQYQLETIQKFIDLLDHLGLIPKPAVEPLVTKE